MKKEKKREGNNLCVVFAHDCCCVCFHHQYLLIKNLYECIHASNRVALIIGFESFFYICDAGESNNFGPGNTISSQTIHQILSTRWITYINHIQTVTKQIASDLILHFFSTLSPKIYSTKNKFGRATFYSVLFLRHKLLLKGYTHASSE